MAASNKTTLEGQNRPAPRAAHPGLAAAGHLCVPVSAGLRLPGSARGACHASKFSYNPPLARFGWRLNGELPHANERGRAVKGPVPGVFALMGDLLGPFSGP